MSEISDKLEYVAEITRKEVKQFTCYDNYKEQIDAITGEDNLDFPFEKAEASEFVIKITMPDGSHLFLPIYTTDGQGFRYDETRRYSTMMHRPLSQQEIDARESEVKRAEEAKKKREEWEAEQRAKNASSLEKAKLLVKKKISRDRKIDGE